MENNILIALLLVIIIILLMRPRPEQPFVPIWNLPENEGPYWGPTPEWHGRGGHKN